jgi:hypothetical protein
MAGLPSITLEAKTPAAVGSKAASLFAKEIPSSCVARDNRHWDQIWLSE